MTFTPGPWSLHNSGGECNVGHFDGYLKSEIKAGSDIIYIRQSVAGRSFPQLVANLVLMIAAPDMLAALKLALKQIKETHDALLGQGLQIAGWHLNGALEPVESFFSDSDCGAVEAIEAAIAKAEGRTA